MKSCEEMTRDVLERRDEEVTRIRKRRKGILGAASGIAVCVLAVLLVPGILKRPAEPAGPVSPADPSSEIVWTGDRSTAVSPESGTPDIEPKEPFIISDSLRKAMENASPDDRLAFTVSFFLEYDSNDPLERLKKTIAINDSMEALGQKSQDAEDAQLKTGARIANKIFLEQDVTDIEAAVRAENDPEYIAAKKARLEAVQEFAAVWAGKYYEGRRNLIDALGKNGLTVVSTCWDDGFTKYTNISNCIAVFAGTREMIASLSKEDFGKDISRVTLYATRPIDDSFFQPPAGKRLAGDSKLTEGLAAQYKENGGSAVRVLVHLGRTGDPEDPSDLALKEIGMTRKEYEETKDLSDEIVEKYHEALLRYTFWVTPEVVEPLLKDGELVEVRSGSWTFTADLTYERAMELCGEKTVAYISMFGEDETGAILEHMAFVE